MIRAVAVALAAGALALGCGGDDEAEGTAASRWTTWVIRAPASAGDEPPRSARSGRAVVGPWMLAAMDAVAARTKDPPASSRAYALVAVAMHDAVVAAASRGLAVEPAVAGAAERVLAYAFPEGPVARWHADAVEAGAGSAGAEESLTLGRSVGDAVVAHGRRDGSARRWSGRVPRGRGRWAPPPGSVARPVQPLAGRWKTWVLPSGDAVRPPPPPAFGSDAYLDDVREIVRVRRSLTPEQEKIARYWAGGEGTPLPAGVWNQIALDLIERDRLDPAHAARVLALLNVGMADAGVAAWDAKYTYWTPRPENAVRDLGVDPDFEPLLETPFFPSYVSGHATYSGAAAETLAHLFPEDAVRLRDKAEEAALSRVLGGIHFRSDNETGLKMGRAIGALVVARAERDENG